MVETTGTEIVFAPPARGAVPGRLDREIARPLLTGTARSVLAIHYRVTGTTAASTTDTERSLLRPLLAASDPGSKVQVHVAGGLGVAIACPQLPAVRQSCGRGSPPSLEAGPLTAASSTVVLVTSRG